MHQIATYEEFGTLLVEIEACLNSWPLCALPNDLHTSYFLLDTFWLRRPLCALPNDPHLSYLSPGHFLIGEPLTQLPTLTTRTSNWVDCPGGKLTTTTPELLEEVVYRLPSWAATSPMLASLIPHHPTWRSCVPEGGQHGSTPLAHSGHHWVHPGADGNTSGHSQDPKGTFKHPISKICPLPHVKNEL